MNTEHSEDALSDRRPVVLVVEDDVLIRMATAEALRECEFEVLEAASAEEAQFVFSTGTLIDVVFSDINLPDKADGVALALWIAARYPDIPLVLTSGVFGAQRAAALACRNVREFIEKPYSHGEVEIILRNVIGGRSRGSL